MSAALTWCQDNWVIILLVVLVVIDIAITKAWRSHKFPPSLDLPWRHW